MSSSSRAAVFALLFVTGSGLRAHAQEATEAQLLFERGAELYRERRFGEALEAMVASNRLVPNANVVFNVAQIYELLERPMDAFNWYQRHLQFALEDDARTRAQQRVEALLPRVAVLQVQTDPDGAELYLDRVELGVVGRAPSVFAVPPGAHTVIARFPGYREASARVTANLAVTAATAISLQQLVGRIELQSEPKGASVFLAGRREALGVTPVSLELPAGPASLSLRLDGYLEQTVELSVAAETVERRRLVLRRDSARFAKLSIAAQPRGALVRLDGERMGATPLELDGLQPGTRALEIVQPDHEPWRTRLQLSAGTTSYVRANLVSDDERPWPYWPWLGYGMAGALLLSGVAVGAAAVSENKGGADAADIDRLNHTADALMAGGVLLGAVTLVLQLTGSPPPRSSGSVAARP
jgi:outer membrane receptor for ferrienterochelin and colicins